MSRRRLLAFFLLFILSGALGLVYEVLWQRLITLQIGVSALSVGVVLAAYMAGLALGAGWGARKIKSTTNAGQLYGLLEIGIGLYAWLMPHLIDGLQPIFALLYAQAWPPLVFFMAQGLMLFLLLLPPTLLMGASFPVLVEALVVGQAERGAGVSKLYAANALGALLGCIAGSFFFLRHFGLSQSLNIAAFLSISLGVMGWILARPQETESWEDFALEEKALAGPNGANSAVDAVAEAEPESGGLGLRLRFLGAVALSGASTMVYEVAWTRLLAVQLGSSIYAFTVMLATFLGGLFLGAALAQKIIARWPKSGEMGFCIAQILAVAWVLVSRQHYDELSYYFVDLFHFFGSHTSAYATQMTLSAFVMLPATIALGLALPLSMAIVAQNAGGLSRRVGQTYMVNTLGSVMGTLAAAFGLLPLMGTMGTLFLAMLLNLMALIVMASLSGRKWGLSALSAAAVMALLALSLTPEYGAETNRGGVYRYAHELADATREEVDAHALGDSNFLYFKEGLNATVTVGQSLGSGQIWLANNGKVDASTGGDMSTQLMLAHIPLWVKSDAKDVAVIGLASGVTAGAVLTHPVETLTLFELEVAVVEASHFFNDHNGRPLEDPRTQLKMADARRHFQFDAKTYDVVISEPSNPWVSGVSNLFTVEFWHLVRARLAPGGILCQWFQLYELTPTEWLVLLRTFRQVFPHVQVFGHLGSGDLMVVGSVEAMDFGPGAAKAMMANPKISENLAQIEIHTPWDLMIWSLFDGPALDELVGEGPINSDDNARIELMAPLTLYRQTSALNTRMLVDHRLPVEWVFDDALETAELLDLALAYERADYFHFAQLALDAYQQRGGDAAIYQAHLKRVLERYEAYPYLDVAEYLR